MGSCAALEGVASEFDARFKADEKSLQNGEARRALAKYRKEHPSDTQS